LSFEAARLRLAINFMEFIKIIEVELLVEQFSLTIYHSKLQYSIDFMIANQITEFNSNFVEDLVLSLLDYMILRV
jgi:hypothetical protein